MGVRVPDVGLELLARGSVVRLSGVLPGVTDAVLAGHGHGGRCLVHGRVAHRLTEPSSRAATRRSSSLSATRAAARHDQLLHRLDE